MSSTDAGKTTKRPNGKLMTLLKRHRMAEGLTMKELARKVGVTAAAVQAWESGRWEPRPRHVPKLAKALAVTPLHLTRILSPDVDEKLPVAAA